MLVTEDESITHIYDFHDKDSGKLVWKKSESKNTCLSTKGDVELRYTPARMELVEDVQSKNVFG